NDTKRGLCGHLTRWPVSRESFVPQKDSLAGIKEHELEAHLAALSRLACRLLGQRANAEDIVQEACLSALQRSAPPDDPSHWLADAVRRLARKAYVSERSRREREQRAAHPEAQIGAAYVVADKEILDELHRRVQGLQEPYRTAISLRFFDG